MRPAHTHIQHVHGLISPTSRPLLSVTIVLYNVALPQLVDDNG